MVSNLRAVERPPSGPARDFVVGLDLPPAGRLLRFAYAAAAVWYRIGHDASDSGAYFLRTVEWLAVIAVGYTLLYGLLLAARLPERLNTWTCTGVMLLPVLVYPLHLGTSAFHDGFGLYVLLSFVLAPVMNYGGLEVATLPSLVMRRRTRLYCGANMADAAVRAFRAVPADGRGTARAVCATLTVLYFAVYWVGGMLTFVGSVENSDGGFRLPGAGPLIVLVPVVWLALQARRAGAGGQRRVLLSGALLLLPGIPAGTQVPDMLWGLMMGAGLVAAVLQAVPPVRRRVWGADGPVAPAVAARAAEAG